MTLFPRGAAGLITTIIGNKQTTTIEKRHRPFSIGKNMTQFLVLIDQKNKKIKHICDIDAYLNVYSVWEEKKVIQILKGTEKIENEPFFPLKNMINLAVHFPELHYGIYRFEKDATLAEIDKMRYDELTEFLYKNGHAVIG